MKKKIFLALALSIMLVCLFAIAVSAAPQSYYSFEVVTTSGETVRVYGTQSYDIYEGRVYVYDTIYTEPPLDSEGTYATIDTLTIKKIDFTNAWIKDKGENEHREYGKNFNNSKISANGSTTPANFANVEEIDFGKATNIGGFCKGWQGLKRVYIPAIVPEGASKQIDFGSDTFRGCSNLAKIEFGDGVTFKTSNKQWVFAGTAIKEIDCSKYVDTYICSNMFSGCTKLESFTLPANMTEIWGGAFYGCTSLKTFIIPEDSKLCNIGGTTFRDCTSLQSINLVDGIYSIGNDCFRNSGLTYVKLPNGIATHDNRFLGYNTFMDCKYLTTIDFSNCPMKSLSVSFANNCDGLRYLSLPEGFKNFSGTDFDGCDNLEAVYMPNSVETLAIGGWNNGSFANCPKLYFVNEPITAVANFADFKMPAKPLVYFMPTSLISQNDPANGIAQIAGPFVKCKNLNKYLVFPEGFTNFNTNDNWFKFCGSKENPINIVCLGDMTDVVYNSAAWDRSCYISYYFMNENDQSLEDVKFTNTAATNKTEGAYVYFCQSGTKYEIVGNSKDLVAVELTEGENIHVHNPKANAYMEATCTTAEGDFTFCFCGAELSFVKAENGEEALGHIYNKVVNKIFPTIEGGSIDYYADATYVYACPQCKTDVEEVKKGSSLFTKSGFSANESDMTDVVFIVYINYANIEAYLAENEGVEIVYGLVASANTTGKPLSYADGKVEAAANTVKVDMTGLSYNKLTMRITNVGANELHCAGYVSYNGEISYLNHETTNEEAAIVSLSIINDMLFPSEDEGADEGTEEVPAE